jgi:cephalosporin hydroxylase
MDKNTEMKGKAPKTSKATKHSNLSKAADEFMLQAMQQQYQYHFTWLGQRIIQFPADIVALQEIIWQCQPDLIIETGVAHGGSTIFYASMLQLLNKGKVLSVEIELREENRKALLQHPLFHRIQIFEGSSLDQNIIQQVTDVAKQHKKIMLCLDSHHTQEHVLQELRIYAPLVTPSQYCVVFDTNIEKLPKGTITNRPWDKGNNPATAVKVFLQENNNFKIDTDIDNKLLISSNPSGYLRRC